MMTDNEQLETLRKDLSLVLPADCLDMPSGTAADGKSEEVTSSLRRVAALIDEAKAPAIVGLNGLTIEAVRLAVQLARRIGAKLLPLPFSQEQSMGAFVPTQMTATLGEAIAADLKIVPRSCEALQGNPIDTYIADHVPNQLFVDPGFDALLALRQQIELRGSSVITETTSLEVKRVVVVLPASTNARVISQWHLIACKIQHALRLSIVLVPDVSSAGNLTGAIETMTWMTGVAPTRGGLDFSSVKDVEVARPMPLPKPCAFADVLMEQGAIDLVIDTGLLPKRRCEKVKHWVRLGREDDAANQSDVHLKTLGLPLGLRGRVMRFDGVTLWLCADPSCATNGAQISGVIDDPAVKKISHLLEVVGRK